MSERLKKTDLDHSEYPDPDLQLRDRSGAVVSTDPVVSLFYSLLRDHVSPSTLETLVREIEHGVYRGHHTTKYTNGWLAQYAIDLAQRLEATRPK